MEDARKEGLDFDFKIADIARPHERYFNHDKVPNYWEKEVLDRYYEKYIYNLGCLNMKTEWVRVKDIELTKPLGWMCLDDRFLFETMAEPEKLGRDILENGTYWAICLEKEDGVYKIRDGIHRIYSIRHLIEIGELPEDFEMFSIIRNEEADNRKAYSPVAPAWVSDDFVQFYSMIYKENSDFDESQEFFELCEGTRFHYLATMMYALLLRNAMYEHKERTGEAYKGHPIINDKSAWEAWYYEK